MAQDVMEDDREVAPENAPPAGGESSPLKKISLKSKPVKTLGLLVLVMVVEAAGIYVWLPQPSAQNADVAPEDLVDVNSFADTVEVKIGDFRPTSSAKGYQGGDITLEFTLAAEVSKDVQESFRSAIKDAHQFRVRQAVERVCRSASREQLDDPNLSTLKRLLREEINKVLGQSYIIQVLITDWQIHVL